VKAYIGDYFVPIYVLRGLGIFFGPGQWSVKGIYEQNDCDHDIIIHRWGAVLRYDRECSAGESLLIEEGLVATYYIMPIRWGLD
jgi:hypothetical protein